MKVALFLKDEKMYRMNIDAARVLIFTIEDGKITGMEDNSVYPMNINYVSLWLITNKIREAYIQKIDKNTQNYFKSVGITMHTFDEINENHIFRAFMF